MKRRRLDRIRHLDWAWQRCRAWFTFPPTILNMAEALGIEPRHVSEVFIIPDGSPTRLRGLNGAILRAPTSPREVVVVPPLLPPGPR